MSLTLKPLCILFVLLSVMSTESAIGQCDAEVRIPRTHRDVPILRPTMELEFAKRNRDDKKLFIEISDAINRRLIFGDAQTFMLDLESRSLIRFNNDRRRLHHIAISPDGRYAALSQSALSLRNEILGQDRVLVVDAKNRREVGELLGFKFPPVVRFLEEKDGLITVEKFGSMICWNWREKRSVWEVENVWCGVVSKDARYCATIVDDGRVNDVVHMNDLRHKKLISTSRTFIIGVDAMELSNSGQTLVAGYDTQTDGIRDGMVRIVDIPSGRVLCIRAAEGYLFGGVKSVRISQDGSWGVFSTRDMIHGFSCAEGKELFRIPISRVLEIQLAEKDRVLVGVCNDGYVRTWEIPKETRERSVKRSIHK